MASRRKKQPAYVSTPPMMRTGWQHEKGAAHYYGEHMRFIVHGIHYMPGKWFVSSASLQVDGHELPTLDFEEAKREALLYLVERLRAYGTDLNKALHALQEKTDG